MNIVDFTHVSANSDAVLPSYMRRYFVNHFDELEIIFCTFAVLGGKVIDAFHYSPSLSTNIVYKNDEMLLQ